LELKNIHEVAGIKGARKISAAIICEGFSPHREKASRKKRRELKKCAKDL
jgi:hypothetical protein